MKTALTKSVELNNGILMPQFGLGVYQAQDGEEVVQAIKKAVSTGYRSIDTAAVYSNEAGVGKGIRECGVHRGELFITTKVYDEQGYESTLQAFDASLTRLGLDYVDLYLIHWPVRGKFKETWKALEQIYKNERAKAIGVSNFQIYHLQDLMSSAYIKPAVNQVEFHPLLTQSDLLEYCRNNEIQLEAWSPIMQGNLDLPELRELGDKYGKTPAQIVLRWDIQMGVITIPKSVTPSRIEENAQIFDFELSPEDQNRITALNQNRRFGSNPDYDL
jgi:diketogulonate reductase-like aldo/keto reductase